MFFFNEGEMYIIFGAFCLFCCVCFFVWFDLFGVCDIVALLFLGVSVQHCSTSS